MTSENRSFVAPAPQPRSDRRGLVIACAVLGIGLAVLALVLAGAWRGLTPAATPAAATPPPIVLGATPIAASGEALDAAPGVIVAPRSASEQVRDEARFRHQGTTHVPTEWESGFYSIYATAQRTFAVNWLLLASIHKQETAFSTSPSTYHGLNFAHCCGGPMQFNVTNGPVTTWRLVMGAYRFGSRPSVYNHVTAHHPSIYDDFDSIMAAGWLLSSNGAGMTLTGAAWQAAYDYYGHDDTGVTYADQVLARAIGWSQSGFCINCALSPSLLAAVHAAYGAPALARLAVVSPGPSAAPARGAARRARAAVAHAAPTATAARARTTARR